MGGSIGAEVLVVPVLTVMSTLLGAQISPGGIWVWKNVAQDQLLELLQRTSQFIYFLLVIVIDCISNIIPLHSFYFSALSGISVS